MSKPTWRGDPTSPWWPLDRPGLTEGQEHDPEGDVWAKHTGSPPRDKDADRATARAEQAERHGEYGPDGSFQPSTWESA